jgi:exopolysaccharide biosynthesis polyprenyl glycosylphosphotransferase
MTTQWEVAPLDAASVESTLAEEPRDPPARAFAAWPDVPSRERRGRAWLVHRLLAGADLLGLSLAFALAQLALGGADTLEVALLVASLPVWVVTAKLYGLYDRDEQHTAPTTVDDFTRVFHLVTVGLWLLLALGWLLGGGTTVPRALVFWALSIVMIVMLRAVARVLACRSPLYVQRAIIVGAGDVGQTVAQRLLAHPEYGVELLGFVDDRPTERQDGLGDLSRLGSLGDVTAIVSSFGVDRVIVAFSNDSHEDYLELLRQLTDVDVQVDVVPRLFEMIGTRAEMSSLEGIPVVSLPPPRLARLSGLIKRAMDLTLATIGVVLLSPFLLVVALAIRMTSPGPVIFRQVRMGYEGTPFEIFKFRTMVANAEDLKAEVSHLNVHLADDPRMFKIPDDPRTTSVGRFLRRWDLDELPQLFNVIRGEMSLVGPRPLILEEDAYVETWGRRRLDLKPGITGPWQALGASTIPFKEMVRLDYLYITNWSLSQDVKWIWRTIARLIGGKHPVRCMGDESA